jgi:hypothetical protein
VPGAPLLAPGDALVPGAPVLVVGAVELALVPVVAAFVVLVELVEELPHAARASAVSTRLRAAIAGLLLVLWISGIDFLCW